MSSSELTIEEKKKKSSESCNLILVEKKSKNKRLRTQAKDVSEKDLPEIKKKIDEKLVVIMECCKSIEASDNEEAKKIIKLVLDLQHSYIDLSSKVDCVLDRFTQLKMSYAEYALNNSRVDVELEASTHNGLSLLGSSRI